MYPVDGLTAADTASRHTAPGVVGPPQAQQQFDSLPVGRAHLEGEQRAEVVAPDRLFVGPDLHADVTIIVVTYNNSAEVEGLIESLRRQIGDQSVRLVAVDNGSVDGTLEKLRRHQDIVTIASGRNLGYGGGVNVGRRHIGDASSVLVLNPDLVLEAGALHALRERIRQPGVGVVVPRIVDWQGKLYLSLRREPTLLRALGDAVLGPRFASRPAWLSETERGPGHYLRPHRVDWATGAALLIDRRLESLVGDWDEQFFLYSEEVDFQRRVRDAGGEVWYEPSATARHRQGGSGSSAELDALLAVNRVRYQAKWRGPRYAALFHLVVILDALLRVASRRQRTTLELLLRRRRWASLPSAAGQERHAGRA